MVYTVTVKPNSKKGPLVVPKGSELVVYLRERPIDGAANLALVKLLSKHFGIAKSCIRLKSGAHSRQKIIEVLP